MENNKPAAKFISNIVFRYGLISCSLYIIYFFIMKAVGLIYITELRFVNYFFYFIAGYYALKYTKNNSPGHRLRYLQGLVIAFLTGALSFLFFSLFIFIYSYFDSFFIDTILKEYPSANVMGRFAPPFLVTSEGIGMSTIISFCLMQYFKIYSGRKRRFFIFGKPRQVLHS